MQVRTLGKSMVDKRMWKAEKRWRAEMADRKWQMEGDMPKKRMLAEGSLSVVVASDVRFVRHQTVIRRKQ